LVQKEKCCGRDEYYISDETEFNLMPSRYSQLLQLLEEAKVKGDVDQVDILEQELYTMKNKKQEGGEIKVKSGGYISDLL
jgi:hypothetical protein